MKLNLKAFALTCGIFWGLSIFLITWWMILIHGSQGYATPLAYFYIGYSLTGLGSLIGLAWGFADGLIAGAIFAWIYNRLVGKDA